MLSPHLHVLKLPSTEALHLCRNKTSPNIFYNNYIINDNAIEIDFHVIVSYGVSISTVADNLIESVKYKVEEFTGMPVEKINIFVEGVRVID